MLSPFTLSRKEPVDAQRLGKVDDVLDVFLGEDRNSSCNSSYDRDATRPGSPGNRQGPRLKSLFLQKTFPLNRRNVVLHGRWINPEVLPDFPHRGGVLMLGDVVVNEIQDGLLFFRE